MNETNEIFLPAATRKFEDFGFMQAYLSFKSNFSPERRNFGSLITIDDAVLKPGAKGFGLHPHNDTEVVTFLLEGEVLHIDPTEAKHTGTLKAKGVQIISAGTGIMHNEENNSSEKEMKALQIWLLPREKGLKPNYAKAHLNEESYLNQLTWVLTPDGRNGSMIVQQDAFMLYSKTDKDHDFFYKAQGTERKLFIYMIEGEVKIGNQPLNKGDGYGLKSTREIEFQALSGTEFILFDLGSKHF